MTIYGPSTDICTLHLLFELLEIKHILILYDAGIKKHVSPRRNVAGNVQIFRVPQSLSKFPKSFVSLVYYTARVDQYPSKGLQSYV